MGEAVLHLKILAAVVGLGGATVGAVPLAAPAQATTPLCRSSQLVVTLERSEGAAGTHYDTWRMTNVGKTCRTQGWVGAQNYGADGRPLATSVLRVNGPASRVILRNGQHASWVFSYTNPGILGCRPEKAVAMTVTPPDNTTPDLVRPGEPACHGTVNATPVRFGG
jgi:Protein of unknown function (DUF4232)